MKSVRILGCYVKARRGEAMRVGTSLQLQPGLGISGDANAHSASPRQVLLVDAGVYRDLELPQAALRENLLVDGLFAADLVSGHILIAGDVGLRITMACEPCEKLNAIRPGLAREVVGRRGMLARVVTGGLLSVGRELRAEGLAFEPLPPTFGQRIYQALRAVPSGRVTTFHDLTIMAGVTRAYARVIPRTLREAPGDVPVHRAVASDGSLIRRHLPGQAHLLQQEGAEIEDDRVAKRCIWSGDPYYINEVEFSTRTLFLGDHICEESGA